MLKDTAAHLERRAALNTPQRVQAPPQLTDTGMVTKLEAMLGIATKVVQRIVTKVMQGIVAKLEAMQAQEGEPTGSARGTRAATVKVRAVKIVLAARACHSVWVLHARARAAATEVRAVIVVLEGQAAIRELSVTGRHGHCQSHALRQRWGRGGLQLKRRSGWPGTR